VLAGFLLVLAGVLIAIFPQLLSLIVALFLIGAGLNIIFISYYYKKVSRHFDNPFIDFIFRF